MIEARGLKKRWDPSHIKGPLDKVVDGGVAGMLTVAILTTETVGP